MHFLGIEIGGSKLQLATGNESGEIFHLTRREVNRAGGAAAIRDQLRDYIIEFKPKFDWRAIGVGFGGPVDWKTGRICRSHQVDGWNDFALAEWLRDLSGLPVAVENDSCLAAYAEALLGVGRGDSLVFYTNSGSGVGGGLVINGHIFHGALPGQMEFGHLRLDKKGTEIEHRCSGWAVDQFVRTIVSRNPEGILADKVAATRGPSTAALSAALRENCPMARQILEETAEDLAWGLSHVVHLLHPEVIILGGGLALLGEPWREAVARHVPGFIMSAFQPGPRIELSRLQEKVVPTGALLHAVAACRDEQALSFHPSPQNKKTV